MPAQRNISARIKVKKASNTRSQNWLKVKRASNVRSRKTNRITSAEDKVKQELHHLKSIRGRQIAIGVQRGLSLDEATAIVDDYIAEIEASLAINEVDKRQRKNTAPVSKIKTSPHSQGHTAKLHPQNPVVVHETPSTIASDGERFSRQVEFIAGRWSCSKREVNIRHDPSGFRKRYLMPINSLARYQLAGLKCYLTQRILIHTRTRYQTT